MKIASTVPSIKNETRKCKAVYKKQYKADSITIAFNLIF